jgi:hypothetical protein
MVEEHLGVEECLLGMACNPFEFTKIAFVGFGLSIAKAFDPFNEQLFNGGEKNTRENVQLKRGNKKVYKN